MTNCVVPSRQGVLGLCSTRPAGLSCTLLSESVGHRDAAAQLPQRTGTSTAAARPDEWTATYPDGQSAAAGSWQLCPAALRRFRLRMGLVTAGVAVLQVVERLVRRHPLDRARLTAGQGRGGAVTLIQRIGSAAILNLHLHSLLSGGVYRCGAGGRQRSSRRLRPPTLRPGIPGLHHQVAACSRASGMGEAPAFLGVLPVRVAMRAGAGHATSRWRPRRAPTRPTGANERPAALSGNFTDVEGRPDEATWNQKVGGRHRTCLRSRGVKLCWETS